MSVCVCVCAYKSLWVVLEPPEHSIGAVETLSAEEVKELTTHSTPVQSCVCMCMLYVCVF